MKILITGASRGIGAAEAAKLQNDNELFLVASSVKSFRDKLNNATYFGYDLSSPEEIKNCVGEIKSKTNSLDVLVNNVGWMLIKKFEDLNWEEINRLLDTNLRSHLLLTKELLPLLLKSENPQIVFMSSMAAKSAIVGESVYSATKGAITSFANVLRNELVGKVKVTAIHSYGVNTWGAKDNHGLLKPENIAETLEFIITREKNFLVESIDLSSINQWRGGQAPWSPR